jgi:hypothetical protein
MGKQTRCGRVHPVGQRFNGLIDRIIRLSHHSLSIEILGTSPAWMLPSLLYTLLLGRSVRAVRLRSTDSLRLDWSSQQLARSWWSYNSARERKLQLWGTAWAALPSAPMHPLPSDRVSRNSFLKFSSRFIIIR